jgi:hypothetical protein
MSADCEGHRITFLAYMMKGKLKQSILHTTSITHKNIIIVTQDFNNIRATCFSPSGLSSGSSQLKLKDCCYFIAVASGNDVTQPSACVSLCDILLSQHKIVTLKGYKMYPI